VGPAGVLSVICPCEVMPIGDIKVLDSWVYYFPMIGSKWFSFVGSWLDYMPRACRSWGDKGFRSPLGRKCDLSIRKAGDKEGFETERDLVYFVFVPRFLVFNIIFCTHVLGCSRRSTVHWN